MTSAWGQETSKVLGDIFVADEKFTACHYTLISFTEYLPLD